MIRDVLPYPNLEAKLKAVAKKAAEVREANTAWRENAGHALDGPASARILQILSKELIEIATSPTPNPKPSFKDPNARFYTIAEIRNMTANT